MYKNSIQPLECCLVITCLDVMQIYASSSILLYMFIFFIFLTNTMPDGLLLVMRNFYIFILLDVIQQGGVVFFNCLLDEDPKKAS